MGFTLDPRLVGDTIFVASLPVCDVLIFNDARYPWVVLVPRVEDARELHELSPDIGKAVWVEVLHVSSALSVWQGVEKINVGALGNLVPQLHIHIVGRHMGDPAWPGPVWGHSPRQPYVEAAHGDLQAYLKTSSLAIK